LSDNTQPRILVVLDTTETAKKCHLKGKDFLLLDWYLTNEPCAELVLSRMFVDETKNHFRKSHDRAIENLRTAIDDLNKASGRTVVQPDVLPDLSTACDDYNEFLEERLRSWNAEIVEYDSVSTGRLAARGLNANKPFNGGEGKKGLRDAIMWESVLYLARKTPENARIIFVSKNKRDFCNSSGKELHDDLKQDLSELQIPLSKIEVVLGLAQFCEDFIVKLVPETTNLLFDLESGRYDSFSVPELLDKVGTELKSQIDDAASHLPIPPLFDLHALALDSSQTKTEFKSVLKVGDSIAFSLIAHFFGELVFCEYFMDDEGDEIYEGSTIFHDGTWIADIECVLKGPEYKISEAMVKSVVASSTPRLDEE